MEPLDLLLLLLIAGACGLVGWATNSHSRTDFAVSAGFGFLGALLGCWAARLLRLPDLFDIEVGGTMFPLIWAVAGAVFFTILLQEIFSSDTATGKDGS